MKRLSAALIVLVLSVALLSCNGQPQEHEQETGSEYDFEYVLLHSDDPVWEGGASYVIADKHTGIIYLVIRYDGGMVMTPLLDADGNPRIWKE